MAEPINLIEDRKPLNLTEDKKTKRERQRGAQEKK
jgi:hypothetical protein